ncbi:MAG: hypothetical protein H7Z76_09815 [Methylotenera sp.]|nr:hypothetical protein [Flavobacterium sp.]
MKTLQINLSLLIACSIILTSCLTAKKVDRQVAKKYDELSSSTKKQTKENILITSKLITLDNKISTSETKTSNVLPLIIYNRWNYTNTCTLNPQIPINNFTSTVLSASSKGLRDKIIGQTLELSVEKIPNVFAIDDKAHVIFFGYAVGWDDVSIMSDKVDLVVNYKLLKDGTETKKGLITVPYIYDKEKLGMFKSWKKATDEFLDQYDMNITEMSKSFVKKLVSEI